MIAALLPLLILLPVLGFLVNGAIALTGRPTTGASESSTARHPLVTVVGPGVVIAAFALAVALFMRVKVGLPAPCLLYTSDAADE